MQIKTVTVGCFTDGGMLNRYQKLYYSMGGKKHEQKNRKRTLCGAMILGSAVPAMAGSADGKKIALVGKSAGNAFFEIAAKSFVETAEAEGATVDTVYPEAATADAQIKVLDNLISQDYDAICISANDVNALQAKLQEAMDEGIKISCFDSATNPDSRQISSTRLVQLL